MSSALQPAGPLPSAAGDPLVPAPARRSVASVAFPWLLSSTLHTTLFVLLALNLPVVRTNAPPAAGVTLDASLRSSNAAEDSARSVAIDMPALDAPPEEGYFEDDGPVLYADESQPTAAAGGAPSLDDLLSEEPAVSIAGVLPAAAADPGLAGLESGLPSASSMTSEPPPPNRLQGGRARTGVFGLEGEGYKFVYVFDRSGSMDGYGGAPLVAAKSELISSLGDLGQTHQFQIIFYNEQPRIFNPSGQSGRLVFGTDQNKNLARRFVGSITASGATRHVEALEMALRMGPDVIFFLTDADEPRMTPRELAHIAQMNQGTTINTIEFGSSADADPDNFIARLARQNGGQHVYIDVTRLSSKGSAGL